MVHNCNPWLDLTAERGGRRADGRGGVEIERIQSGCHGGHAQRRGST